VVKRDRRREERHARSFLVAKTPLARIRLKTGGNRISRLHRLKRCHLQFGSGSSLAIAFPNSSVRQLIGGPMLAASGPLVAISPLGKLSGAHLNPAVSLAFWLQGKMHQHDLVGSIASQLLGAALGTGLAVLLWRKRAASVHNGVTAQGSDVLSGACPTP
jgi:glycerol uptake facilitator-like aquaporin